jgi:hypothetical protein
MAADMPLVAQKRGPYRSGQHKWANSNQNTIFAIKQ